MFNRISGYSILSEGRVADSYTILLPFPLVEGTHETWYSLLTYRYSIYNIELRANDELKSSARDLETTIHFRRQCTLNILVALSTYRLFGAGRYLNQERSTSFS